MEDSQIKFCPSNQRVSVKANMAVPFMRCTYNLAHFTRCRDKKIE